MGKLLTIVCAAGALLLSVHMPARADDLTDQLQRFHIEGMDKLKQGFDELLRSIPRFEAPTIDENGDIIIKRKPPAPPGADPWTGTITREPEFADI